MKKHKDTIRGFHVSNRAHYKNIINQIQIIIGLYDPKGGAVAEFIIEWHPIGSKLSPQIKMFDDTWGFFYEFRDLFVELSKLDNLNPNQDQIIKLLQALGFKDLTRYKPK